MEDKSLNPGKPKNYVTFTFFVFATYWKRPSSQLASTYKMAPCILEKWLHSYCPQNKYSTTGGLCQGTTLEVKGNGPINKTIFKIKTL